MSTLLQDLRFSLRHLRKTPGFTLAAIGTLALGIGATTAIFSTVNAALLKPLPYPHPENLYGLRTALTDGRVTTGLLSGVEIQRLNDANISVERAAGSFQQDLTLLRDDGAPMKVSAYAVTEGFFEMFGLPMSLGGGFSHENFIAVNNNGGNGNNGPAPVVVISHRVWRDVFSSDPAIVGKAAHFTGFSPVIVGVASKDFDTPHDADFYTNAPIGPQDVGHNFDGYMRLKAGSSFTASTAQMASVMNGIAKDFPASAANRVYVVKSLVDQIIGDLGPILVVVLSATALLLILACVNVTNLLLARGASRAREMAVRVSLGAGRTRIIRQLLTESAVLAAAGAVAGLAVAYGGVRLLLTEGARTLPRLDAVAFDSRVMMFAFATLIVSGFIVGFAPALRLASSDLKTLMNESSRSASGGRATGRWLSGLMIAEIALAVMLVAGAGWLIRGFANLRMVDPGFSTEGRLLFDASFIGAKYPTPASVDAGAQDLKARIAALPGVDSVGMTASFPLRLALESSLLFEFRGEPMDPKNPMGTRQRIVSPGYFSTMGTKILAGRDFTDADITGTQSVALVNKTFAQKYLKGRDPIGVRFSSGYPTIFPQSETMIVGVVDDVRQKSLSEPAEPAFYSSDRQLAARRRTVVLHTKAADPMSLQSAIRSEMAKFDPQAAVTVTPFSELASNTLQRQQLGMQLMLVFGAAALVLAAVGIYGVIAYASSQRQHEVATRLALGASPASVFWLMLRQGRTLALIGAGLGLAAAYLSGRVVSSRLYEVQANDPVILAAATAIVIVIAFVATAVPALRVSRIDAVRAMRPD